LINSHLPWTHLKAPSAALFFSNAKDLWLE
jgi:hypothetical protein